MVLTQRHALFFSLQTRHHRDAALLTKQANKIAAAPRSALPRNDVVSLFRLLFQLDQYTVHVRRMHESNLVPIGSHSRSLVDQLHAG